MTELATGASSPERLGAARSGVHHWWMQRLTALALLPLGLWMGCSLSTVLTSDHARLTAWLQHPWNPLLLVAFLLCSFYHAQLGLQVVIEDYVHGKPAKVILLIAVKLLCALAALGATLAVAKMAIAP